MRRKPWKTLETTFFFQTGTPKSLSPLQPLNVNVSHTSAISSKSRGQTWKPLRVGMDAILGQNHPAERIPSSTFQPSKISVWKPTIQPSNQPFIINLPNNKLPVRVRPVHTHTHIPHLDPTTQVAGRVLHGPLDHLVTIWADFWHHAWLQLCFLRLSTQVGFHRLRLNDVAFGVWDGGGGGC